MECIYNNSNNNNNNTPNPPDVYVHNSAHFQSVQTWWQKNFLPKVTSLWSILKCDQNLIFFLKTSGTLLISIFAPPLFLSLWHMSISFFKVKVILKQESEKHCKMIDQYLEGACPIAWFYNEFKALPGS